MERFRLIDRLRIPTYDNIKHMQGGDLIFDELKCRQCGVCVKICPGGCIETSSATKITILSGKDKREKTGIPHVATLKTGVTLCIACFCCGTACPNKAISIKKNFNPGYFYKRLTQVPELRYPKNY
ncbi:MAG: 4Fe-4S binding protein [Syntrophaceae bacterium]|nr:4Fe-4S binding protein [Syntrophaceae bacterium]